MKRLIFTTSDAGAGCLRQPGIADMVIPPGSRFFRREPLPSDVEITDSYPAEELVEWRIPANKILNEHLELASSVWQAYRAPTPLDWFGLLTRDLSSLPLFGRPPSPCLMNCPGSQQDSAPRKCGCWNRSRKATRPRLIFFLVMGSATSGVCTRFITGGAARK